MTSLVRDPLTRATPVAWRPQDEKSPAPLVDPEIEALQREREDLTKALAKAQSQIIAESESAYARGKADGQATFERNEAERLQALEAALATLVEEGRAQFKHIERLALLLCETSLEAVFDRYGDLKELTTRAIGHQMRGLRRETILSLRVSASDFPDETVLSDLEQRLGLQGSQVRLESDAKMEAGEGVIVLRLGHVEISLPEHWLSLQGALRAMAAAP
jgi:flagellar biosynthesis/type III secretory pathway protein FliH